MHGSLHLILYVHIIIIRPSPSSLTHPPEEEKGGGGVDTRNTVRYCIITIQQ
jgi:hypothetical protein